MLFPFKKRNPVLRVVKSRLGTIHLPVCYRPVVMLELQLQRYLIFLHTIAADRFAFRFDIIFALYYERCHPIVLTWLIGNYLFI